MNRMYPFGDRHRFVYIQMRNMRASIFRQQQTSWNHKLIVKQSEWEFKKKHTQNKNTEKQWILLYKKWLAESVLTLDHMFDVLKWCVVRLILSSRENHFGRKIFELFIKSDSTFVEILSGICQMSCSCSIWSSNLKTKQKQQFNSERKEFKSKEFVPVHCAGIFSSKTKKNPSIILLM